MKNFILIDTLNMFYRTAYSIPSSDVDTRIGLSMHTILNSIKKAWHDFEGSHVIFFLEGKSWRKQIYPEYKANRIMQKLQKTPKELEQDDLMFEAVNDFTNFLKTQTNVSVVRCPIAEADDLIAIWIDMHKQDNHVIVSSDSDFYQLLAPNVKIYNGVTEEIISNVGIFDKKGKAVIDKKTKLPKESPDPEWALFEKCIRGDTSDNIFSAYPGVRIKGTKTKVGIREAFEDRHKKGYAWNNFMLQKWTDHNDREHIVMDKYNFNKSLIDLTLQPENVRNECISAINECLNRDHKSNVGINLMKFCSRWDLKMISNTPTEYAKILNAKYTD